MAARIARSRLFLAVLILVTSFIPLSSTSASPGIPIPQIPYPHYFAHRIQPVLHPADLHRFIQRVSNGEDPTLSGVYVDNTFAFPVVQQPAGQDAYVSDTPGVVTQFRSTAQYGTVGILAHNNLAGADFFNLKMGQTITLVEGDGGTRDYRVSAIRHFQALQPESPYSNFVDLDQTQGQLTSGDLYNQIYTRPDQVVFQTCIAKNGNASWGRIFVIAQAVTPWLHANPVSVQ